MLSQHCDDNRSPLKRYLRCLFKGLGQDSGKTSQIIDPITALRGRYSLEKKYMIRSITIQQLTFNIFTIRDIDYEDIVRFNN